MPDTAVGVPRVGWGEPERNMKRESRMKMGKKIKLSVSVRATIIDLPVGFGRRPKRKVGEDLVGDNKIRGGVC